MKLFIRLIKYIFYSLLIFNLIVAIGLRVTQKPFLISAVRSNSMYPLIRKGDMLLLNNFFRNEDIRKNDIIVFKTESGSYELKGWIVHRIVGGNEHLGYITKGDANQNIDQIDNENPSIDITWIACKIVTINDKPIKIPFIGYLYLWMGRIQDTRFIEFILPIMALLLIIIITYAEMSMKYKKDRKKKYALYILAGLTLSIITGITTLVLSRFYPFLPKKIIYALAKKSFWLAVLIISIIPGLPFMIYPIIHKKVRSFKKYFF